MKHQCEFNCRGQTDYTTSITVDSPCDADYNPPELTAKPIGASLAPFPLPGSFGIITLSTSLYRSAQLRVNRNYYETSGGLGRGKCGF